MFLCGMRPALLYVALAAAVGPYIFVPPYWDFKGLLPVSSQIGLFVASALSMLVVIYYFKREAELHRHRLQDETSQRKRIEAASADNNLRLEGIIDSAMDAIISVDARQRILVFNPAAEQMFGYSAGEVQGTSVERLIPVRFRKMHADHVQKFGETGDSRRKVSLLGNLHGLRRDGSEFPIEASISRTEFAGEQIYNVILRDISERKQAEQVISNHRRQLATFVEQAPISIAMFDRGLNYIAASHRWLADFGRGLADLTGRNHYEVNPDISEEWKRVHREALTGVTIRNDMDTWVMADGTQRWLRWAVQPWTDEVGVIGGLIMSAEDITQAKLVELALQASQDDLVRAQAVGKIGSWRLDVRRNELIWSTENHRIFEIPEGTPLNYETFLSRVHPDDQPYVDRMWKAALAGQPYDIEHRLRIDGKVKWVSERAELEFDANGILIGGFGITQDITEHQVAEHRLKEANSRLAALAAERAAHLQDLSNQLARAEQQERDRLYELLHDHVQPLLVAARLGLSGLGESTPRADVLRVVGDARRQISDVLQTARTLSVELSPPLIRERGLVPALQSLCRWVHSNYGLKVEMACASGTEPASMTIRLLCFKAVRELLMNVVKYAETRRATLELGLDPDDTLRITVRDDGVGFDPAADHVGSGVATLDGRLGMVGGSLTIESSPGSGTTAVVRAPLELRAAERTSKIWWQSASRLQALDGSRNKLDEAIRGVLEIGESA